MRNFHKKGWIPAFAGMTGWAAPEVTGQASATPSCWLTVSRLADCRGGECDNPIESLKRRLQQGGRAPVARPARVV